MTARPRNIFWTPAPTFDEAGDLMEDLVVETVVPRSQALAYRDWTTEEGLRTFLGAELRLDFRRGGDFVVCFDMSQPEGLRGSEGCVVVDYVENEAFVFTWNFPPSLPTIRDQHTIVRVTFEADVDSSGQTRVTLRQTGWRDEGEWPAGFAYFERAWAVVLRLYAESVTATKT